MKTFKVSIWQEVGGTVNVKAKDRKQAERKALDQFGEGWEFERVVHQDNGIASVEEL